MDPYQNRNLQLPSSRTPFRRETPADELGVEPTPGVTGRDPQPGDRRPQHSGGFTMIPPNKSLWSQMKTMAQREEEELQRWRETHRVTSVHEDAERLGGDGTLAEARHKQFANLRCSKLQRKLKREEQEKRRKQEDEEKLQKMKAEQRQKAERLEERRQQEEQSRTERLSPDRRRKTESFLQHLESRDPGALASCSAAATSPRVFVQAVESKPRDKPEKSERDVALEHKRVNADFLHKLEARGRGSATSVEEAERQCPSPAAEQPGPGRRGSDCMEVAEANFDWALMKLVNSFPDCHRAFLRDILSQCGGDYQQAYTLLLG